MVKKKRGKKLTAEQKKRSALTTKYRKQIEQIFVYAGFISLPSEKKGFKFAGFPIEIDHIFVYKNILVLCEDTINYYVEKRQAEDGGKQYKRNHKLEKKQAITAILEHKVEFFAELCSLFSECEEIKEYQPNEFIIRYLYFDYENDNISNEDRTQYSPIVFVRHATMLYFHNMASCIKKSCRYELFKYLDIPKNKIGFSGPDGGMTTMYVTTPIIYPRNVTGLDSGIRIVSFMMSPKDLIENGYVLRKDSWADNEDLYQRLLTPNRIKSVRQFILEQKQTFFNNIIVVLPDGIRFIKNEGEEILLDDLMQYDNQVKMEIPKDFNSIAIIDGQHRVYGYYENNIPDESEEIISRLRNRMNLLVTGIIYPEKPEWKMAISRRKFEGSLFVSINKNAKSVDSDTLIRVQSMMDITEPEPLARKVLEELNKVEPFEGKFQLSKLDNGQIKTASIIKYALASLVSPKNKNNGLFGYWIKENGYGDDYSLTDEDVNEYIKYCKRALIEYFNAIRDRFRVEWDDDNSKILRIISLNAFIIAYRETLGKTSGPQKFDYYKDVFKDFCFSFYDKEDAKFKYSGSRYKAFAEEELIPLFKDVVTI